MQLPNISECAALAEDKPVPSLSILRPESTPDTGANTPKTEASTDPATVDAAASAAVETVSQQEVQKSSGSTAVASHTSSDEQAKSKNAAKQSASLARGSSSEEYVSPFEQAQDPAAAPAQGQSPFANMS